MLALLILLNVTQISAETMKEIFYQKYSEVYDPKPGKPFTYINRAGVEATITLPPLKPIYAESMIDTGFTSKLTNFESNPLEAFEDKNMRMCLVHHAVRDYDPVSKKIIEKCIEFGPGHDFIILLMEAAVHYDREQLFDDLVEWYGGINLTQEELYPYHTPIGSMILQTGRYKYAKKLIIKGIYSAANPIDYARGVCVGGRDVLDAIDFLDFLIVKYENVAVNELALPFARPNFRAPPRAPHYIPLILILLKGGSTAEFKQEVGKYLVSIGADLTIVDEDGKNAIELAEEQGIDLFS